MEEKKDYIDQLNLSSHEVHEIVNTPPKWMIRKGISVIGILIFGILCWTALVSTSDVLRGTSSITTSTPPLKIISNSSGKIFKILCSTGENVKRNQPLCEIRSNLSPNARAFALSVCSHIDNDSIELIDFNKFNEITHGEFQSEMNKLILACEEFLKLKNDRAIELEIIELAYKISEAKNVLNGLASQIEILKSNLVNGKKKMNMYQDLHVSGAISELDFLGKEETFNGTKLQLESLKMSNYSQKLKYEELKIRKEKIELEQKMAIENILSRVKKYSLDIKSKLATWDENYVVRSPIDGVVHFKRKLGSHENVTSGSELFIVEPKKRDLIAAVKIGAKGFGKVKAGQEVLIEINKYPSSQFGYIRGVVKSYSQLSENENYEVEVQLTQGLRTTFGSILEYSPEMSGLVEIHTSKKSILMRIFDSFN